MRLKDMYCIDCNYDLSHLEEFRCPECGVEFDPDDPSTFKPSTHRRYPRIIKIGFALSFYPIAFLLSFHAMWLVAWIVLGHSPIPYADDPKYIGTSVDIFHFTTGLLLICSPIAFIITMALLIAGIAHGALQHKGNPWLALYIMIWYIIAWAATSLYFSWDPLRLIDWYFD